MTHAQQKHFGFITLIIAAFILIGLVIWQQSNSNKIDNGKITRENSIVTNNTPGE